MYAEDMALTGCTTNGQRPSSASVSAAVSKARRQKGTENDNGLQTISASDILQASRRKDVVNHRKRMLVVCLSGFKVRYTTALEADSCPQQTQKPAAKQNKQQNAEG